MMQAYIVTESNDAMVLIKHLLPDDVVNHIKFIPRTDYDWAQSTASTLVTIKQHPVVLILNADSIDPDTIGERQVVNESHLRFSAITRFKVILAVPEIEILLFQDRALLEELLDCEISDVDWARAEFIPRIILQKLLAQAPEPPTLEQLLDQLTPVMIDRLRHHPLVQELTEFLVKATALQSVLA